MGFNSGFKGLTRTGYGTINEEETTAKRELSHMLSAISVTSAKTKCRTRGPFLFLI